MLRNVDFCKEAKEVCTWAKASAVGLAQERQLGGKERVHLPWCMFLQKLIQDSLVSYIHLAGISLSLRIISIVAKIHLLY